MTILKIRMMNLSFSSDNHGAIHTSLQFILVQNSWYFKELNTFCHPSSSDDLCLIFCIDPSSMTYLYPVCVYGGGVGTGQVVSHLAGGCFGTWAERPERTEVEHHGGDSNRIWNMNEIGWLSRKFSSLLCRWLWYNEKKLLNLYSTVFHK